MANNDKTRCRNCSKIGCYGVQYRSEHSKKQRFQLQRMEPACQWCNASLKPVNKWAWLEYVSVALMIMPLFFVELFPSLSSGFLIALVFVGLILVVASRLLIRYEFAYRYQNRAGVQQDKIEEPVIKTPITDMTEVEYYISRSVD